MKKLRRLLLAVLCIVLIAPCMNVSVSAATQKQNAINAYRKLLSASKVYVLPRGEIYYDANDRSVEYNGTKAANVKFLAAYIDNDDIPELIVTARLAVHSIMGFSHIGVGKSEE